MRRLLVLFLTALLLLCAVACNNDPYRYKYDESSYLGNWEINIAPIEGDVDGCIQLLQYEFKSDFTYSVVAYEFNAQTKEIVVIEDFDEGFFEYDYDVDTAIGTLTMDGGPNAFYWNADDGLSTIILGKLYQFNRPQYVITEAENQKDITGIWERRDDSYDTSGKDITQMEFKSDGSLDIYNATGVYGPGKQSETTSWKYKDAEVEKSYSRTWVGKWGFGSEIYVSATPSSIGEPLHEKGNFITVNEYLEINDNGDPSVVDLFTARNLYKVLQYGERKILFYAGQTYVKVANKIDLSEKYKEIVYRWFDGGVSFLYLRSDGTYGTDLDDLLNYDRPNETNAYTGRYSATYDEVTTGDVVAFEEARYRVENPGVEPVGGWDAWRVEQAALIEAQKVTNYVKLYIGTIKFIPDFGFEETFDIMMMIETPKYGLENPYGDPDPSYSLTIRNVDKEGTVNYLDFTEL